MHLFGKDDPRAVVQNFADDPVETALSVDWDLERRLTLPADAETSVEATGDDTTVAVGPRSLVVL